MKFFTSDLHFNHTNIIHLCNRPFKDAIEMNRTLIDNWNAKVRKNDEVYFLGDAGLGHGKVFSKHLRSALYKLNGTIHFITGNHDKETLKVASDRFKTISDLKTTKVHYNGRSYHIVMCHYPMLEWNGSHRGYLHAFGHCHGNLNKKFWSKGTHRWDVGVDSNKYAPLSETELMERLL